VKLYLSSYRVPSPLELFSLVGRTAESIKVAVIPNAKDYYADRARQYKIKSAITSFNEIGIVNCQVVDLREHKEAELLVKLGNYDLIWVLGGNTFCLMEAVVQSGFNKVIKSLLESGVVYGGDSAGAIIAGESLRGVEYCDEPEFAEKQIWEGMSLVSRIIVPHVGSQYYGTGVDEMIKLHAKKNNLVKINDNQAFIVNSDDSRIV
jgi:dipeptidase E